MGHEPDADQRLDAQVQTFGSLARGRSAGTQRFWPIEIGRLPAPFHHRRFEGSLQGDPSGFRTRRGHSTLSDTCCQIHKARNIMDRLPKSMHAQVRRVLRQAWELDDAGKAETLLRNLARHLEKDWEGVSASILEGLDEMLTVTKLGLPPELRRSLACTNIIENVMGTVRRFFRNVKYWRSPSMALRWASAAMQEAAKGFIPTAQGPDSWGI